MVTKYTDLITKNTQERKVKFPSRKELSKKYAELQSAWVNDVKRRNELLTELNPYGNEDVDIVKELFPFGGIAPTHKTVANEVNSSNKVKRLDRKDEKNKISSEEYFDRYNKFYNKELNKKRADVKLKELKELKKSGAVRETSPVKIKSDAQIREELTQENIWNDLIDSRIKSNRVDRLQKKMIDSQGTEDFEKNADKYESAYVKEFNIEKRKVQKGKEKQYKENIKGEKELQKTPKKIEGINKSSSAVSNKLILQDQDSPLTMKDVMPTVESLQKATNDNPFAITPNSPDVAGAKRLVGKDKNKVKFKNSNIESNAFGLTAGDITGLVGTVAGAIGQTMNTISAAKATKPNVNRYVGFNEKALAANRKLQMNIQDNEAVAKRDMIRRTITNAGTNKSYNRKGATGMNQLRAMDLATDVNTNEAQINASNQIEQLFGNQFNQAIGNEQQLLSQKDQMEMQGWEKVDEKDQMDLDNMYSNYAQNLATMTEGMQVVGGNMNRAKERQTFLDVLDDTNPWGFGFDNNMNMFAKPVKEEIATPKSLYNPKSSTTITSKPINFKPKSVFDYDFNNIYQ